MIFRKGKIYPPNFIIRLIILNLLILGNILSAQNLSDNNISESDIPRITRPMLNGHKFVVNPFFGSPFIKTFFRNTLGFGKAVDLYVPIIIIDDKPLVGLRGDISFLALDFEYQYGVNSWLAMFGRVGMLTRFGSEAQSLIAQGLNASYGMQLGWLFKIVEKKNLMISVTANLWNKTGTVMNLYDFVEEIIDSSGLTDDNALLYSRDYIQGGGGIRMAWAITKNFGMQAIAEAAYGESIDDISRNDVYYKFGVSGDLDLKTVNPEIPLGFSVGFLLDSFARSNDNTVDGNSIVAFLRASYTGRDDILISLDFSFSEMPISTSDKKLKSLTTFITLEYFFN